MVGGRGWWAELQLGGGRRRGELHIVVRNPDAGLNKGSSLLLAIQTLLACCTLHSHTHTYTHRACFTMHRIFFIPPCTTWPLCAVLEVRGTFQAFLCSGGLRFGQIISTIASWVTETQAAFP